MSFCQLCGNQIHGRGKSIHHPDWSHDLTLQLCVDCYQNKPHCKMCGIPIDNAAGLGICPTCSTSVSLCLACGKPVFQEYVEIDGIGIYCVNCYHDRSPCDVCGAPLTDDRWQLSDGRISCAHCHATAIYDPQEASALYDEMKTTVRNILGLHLNIPTGLALVDRDQLEGIIHKQIQNHPHAAGEELLDPHKTLGIYTRRGIRRGIYVQNGLPRTLLLQIAAHEFAHAWQGENCPLLRDLTIREGFAEWVSYKVLEAYGFTQQQERIKKRTDVYGTGLNWALALEKETGSAGVIDACRSAEQ